MQIVTSETMRELDRQAIETIGIPGMVLMENAGRGTVELMEKHHGLVQGKTVIIFVGPGNNGGDGLVIARTIINKGGTPYILFLVEPNTLKGDAAYNYQIIEQMGLGIKRITTKEQVVAEQQNLYKLCRNEKIHSIVDAVFGIGLDREVENHFASAIKLINKLAADNGVAITSADIPSGLNSDTGATMGVCVTADLTVTYGYAKPAHFHNGGAPVGTIERVDIGIPPILEETIPAPHIIALTTESIPAIQSKNTNSHKGSNGHVAVIAGSEGKTGAAILSARGAIHSHAGLVTLFSPEKINQVYEISLIEAMSVALPHSSTYLTIDDYQQIRESLSDKNSVILGPGLGTNIKTAELVTRLYRDVEIPMVVDADALNILAEQRNILSQPGGPRILTPHPGEMARLISTTVAKVQSDRTSAIMNLNDYCSNNLYDIITVLKGAGTVVASTDSRWCINTTGNPGMGSGGMGDVLAGIIGSFLAQGYNSWDSAALGVFIHGFSADLLSMTTPYGYSAEDVAKNLPTAISQLLTFQCPDKLQRINL